MKNPESAAQTLICSATHRPLAGRLWRFLFVLCLCLGSFAGVAVLAQEEPPAPRDLPPIPAPFVSTDQADYAPGSTAVIFGSGFLPGETVTLQVPHADGTPNTGADHAPWTIIADALGSFQTTWHVCEDDCLGSLLTVKAIGGTSGLWAEHFFTDSHGGYSTMFFEDFHNNSAGWSLGPQWQIGSATVSSGHVAGNPDPGVDVTPTADNGIAGVVIGGNTGTALHGYYYLTSPVINIAAAPGQVLLEYYRWLNSDYLPYMQNTVEVFNGSTWVTVWATGNPPPVYDNAWVGMQHDVTAYKNPNFRVRFGYRIGSSGVWSVSSWNIDNFSLLIPAPNQPPVAQCQNVTVYAGVNCTAAASINNGSFDPNAGDTVTVTQMPAGPYSLGNTVVQLTVTDSHGASSICTATVTVIDNTPPVIIGCPTSITVQTGLGRTTCDQVATWTAPTASDNCSVASFTSTHASGAIFPVGTTIVTYTAIDGATPPNSITCNFTVTVEDTTAPVIIGCPVNIILQTGLGRTTCDQMATWTPPTASDNCTVVSFTSTHAPGATFPVGTTTVTSTATDVAGNISTCSFTVTVQDNTPPVITGCPANNTRPNDPGLCGAVVTYSAPVGTDNCSGATTLQTAGLPSGATFPIGTTVNTFEVTDAAGNKTACSFSVTVNDTEAPKIACPAPITQPNDPGLCGAVVTYAAPVGTDNCSGAATVQTAGLSSGATFPIGTTVNTFEVTDASGNVTTCSFNVTVNDTEFPTIACPAAITQPNDAGVCGAVVTYTTPVGADNCPGAATVQTAGLPSGATFPIGTTLNTFEVTDAAGNKTACSFSVTVNDTEAPKITCPAPITRPNDAGVCGAVVAYTAPVGTDNCPGATTVQTAGLSSGATFPIGTTVNTFEVTDASGNKTACSFSVTVNDAEAPKITCPADKLVNADPLVCTAVVSGIGPTSAGDNCPGFTIAYTLSGATTGSGPNNASGRTFNLGVTTVTYTITDAAGLTASCSFTVTVVNPNPVVTLTGPASGSLYAINTPVNFTATFTDAGGGTHTGTWMLDSIPQAAAIVEPNGATPGSANATYTFTAPGVYTVKLTVNDGCGGSGTANQIGEMDLLVVVYDPSAGFVTGGGWINSPVGAYVADPSLTGKANFGFVSKYQKGTTIPTGETEFQLRFASFNFHSTSYQWLVVSGAKAQYKGFGQINGTGDYGFLLTATDGQFTNGGGVDRFRIKIWDRATSVVVYDNAMDSPEDIDLANPLAIGGGSIVLHKAK